MMKSENHMFQGMKRGVHQIKQDAQFLWDAHNIRLTNREDNTLLEITNEKGTSETGVTFAGEYVGHCVLGKYLVVFTAESDWSNAHIYRVEKKQTGYESVILFHNPDKWDEGWNPKYPIETLGVYETELVQKVYWIDGKHQPRVINIMKDKGAYDNISEPFNFVSTIKLLDTVEVTKIYGDGMFSPGTIQYAFTYYNKYGQESNIFNTTSLNYVSPKDRGGNPEEKVANSFKITIDNVDTNFEYLRIYSIHRTSIDAIPTIKRVIDIPIEGNGSISYVDTGTTGETIDPNLLLYIGGREIIASSICAKDGTLFLGNIELKEAPDWLDIKTEVKNRINPETWEIIQLGINHKKPNSGEYYDYNIDLGNPGFKTGETYRLGIQFQYKTGIWSEPIFLADDTLNNKYPYYDEEVSFIIWESQAVKLDEPLVTYLKSKGYVRARACVVFPSIIDRTIICQGVLCPTVYSVGSRESDSPYAMSSWFFRPQVSKTDNNNNVYKGATIQYQHNRPLFTGADRGAEIQCTQVDANITSIANITSENIAEKSNFFFVDSNLVTFHSPDVEFDTSIQNLIWDDSLELKIVGDVQLGSSIGDISITSSSSTIGSNSPGFVHKIIGFPIGDTTSSSINGGLVSGLFYQDSIVQDADNNHSPDPTFHLIYPWHRSGSLNNSPAVNAGTRSAILSKKKISNLKFFNKFVPAEVPAGKDDITCNICTPKLFSSNEVQVEKVWVDYLQKKVPYYGNVDTVITAPTEYSLYTGDSFSGAIGQIPEGNIRVSRDPVRIKYKSTPHLIFSLKGDSDGKIEIIPTKAAGHIINGEVYTIPDWYNTLSATDNVEEDYRELSAITCSADNYRLPNTKPNDIGKFAWQLNLASVDEGKVFSKATTIDASWNYLQARNEIREGTIFKVVGDGKSCLLVNTKNIFGFGPSGSKGDFYEGEDLYFKATNIKYLSGININKVSGDLVKIVKPSQKSKSRVASQGDTRVISQSLINSDPNEVFNPFLILAELRRKDVLNRFGGDSEEALRANIWIPAGDPISLDNYDFDHFVNVSFKYGDTWYSRYDCLKTYPFTQEDENSIVEIGSFMCETRVNIDGRYDKNRGQLSNLTMTPQNFNHINEVYSQKNNFFTYNIYDEDYYKFDKFKNQITWSTEKLPSSDTDPWLNITLANTLNLDGSKGNITSLNTFNDTLLCFQDKAVSQILFNSRVQIPVSDGVPVEISNGYKVDGYRIIADNIGCQNKWSIANSKSALYFIDDYTDTAYSFDGKLNNISDTLGMKWWFQKNHTYRKWSPSNYGPGSNGIRTFFDPIYNDIYFTPGPDAYGKRDALCYSEQLGQFTSQMSYGGTQAMFQFGDSFFSLRTEEEETNKETITKSVLYENFKGDYNNFFGTTKGWDFSFISNENPTYTKIFDTIELRTDHWKKPYGSGNILNTFPMNYIEVSNEYQKANAAIDNNNMRKKFRVWRGFIPRSSTISQSGIDITRNYGRARIRNPWAMIKMGWKPEDGQSEDLTNKAIIHDISVNYTI